MFESLEAVLKMYVCLLFHRTMGRNIITRVKSRDIHLICDVDKNHKYRSENSVIRDYSLSSPGDSLGCCCGTDNPGDA